MQNFLNYYNKIRAAIDKITEGRHGFDSLSRDCFIVWFVIVFINGFIRSKIVTVASLLLPVISLLRVFSTNSVKRAAECRKYLQLRGSATEFVKITQKRIAERDTHRYYRCKNCSSYIRVKRKPGKHTVVCPKCGKEFQVKIRENRSDKKLNAE